MDFIKNNAESFFREIRRIEIFNAKDLKYIDNLNGRMPKQSAFYSFKVNPDTYDRNIGTKQRSRNNYYPIDLSFSLLELSRGLRNKLYEDFNKRGFAVVLYSNTEKMALGNEDEDLSVFFIDNMKDNNSGDDVFTINISGETIVPPNAVKL